MALSTNKSLINTIKKGGVGILPTDTIYGIVGSALNIQTVEKIYKLRQRNPLKPCIILISSINDLNQFDINPSEKAAKLLTEIWPNPVSVILPCNSSRLYYLHRGISTLAFRMPNSTNLLKFLKQTGPLIAPSANTEGAKPAETIDQARGYFGSKLDFYIDQGKLTSLPSTIISIQDDTISILRQGIYQIPHTIRINT